MATSKKISELTTATALVGDELIPLVQDGETRQAEVSVLRLLSPVHSVNGLTGNVILALGDLTGVEPLVSAQGVSAAIGAVSVRVDTVSALVSANYQAAVSAVASVSVRVDDVSAAITSVQAYVLAQISVATSSVFTEAPNDGQVYGRASQAWVPVSITALQAQVDTVSAAVSVLTSAITSINNIAWPYDIGFDFGASTLPTDEYAKVVAARTFYVLPSCSGSQLTFNTSAFPTAIVSIPIMYPTSVTLGVLLIGTSGTATWPAITTTSIVAGQTFGVQTSVSSDANLKGLVITFVGYYRR
jgi:hypothetical protein